MQRRVPFIAIVMMAAHLELLVLTALMLLSECPTARGQGLTQSAEYKLYKALIEDADYRPQLRPVRNDSTILNVNVIFEIRKILFMDEKEQKLGTLFCFLMKWEDELLQWNPVHYGNVRDIVVPMKDVWTPALGIAESYDVLELSERIPQVSVSSSGVVSLATFIPLITRCVINVRWFPFDVQQCSLTLAPVMYKEDQLRLHVRATKAEMYTQSEEFELMDIHSKHAPPPNWNFSRIETQITIQRYPTYYKWNLLAPLFSLVIMTIMQFLIPLDSGERISYGVTVVLSMTVFQMFFMDQLPETSLTTPFVTEMFGTLLYVSSIALCISIILTRVFTCNPGTKSPPSWLKFICRVGGSAGTIRPQQSHSNKRVTMAWQDPNCKPQKNGSRVSEKEILEQKMMQMIGEQEKKEEDGQMEAADEWKLIATRIDTVIAGLFLVATFSYCTAVLIQFANAPTTKL